MKVIFRTKCIPISTFCLLTASLSALAGDALSNYVFAADQHFTWKQTSQVKTQGFTITRLELTSQKWRDGLWNHHMRIVRPAEMRHPEMAFVYVTGSGSGRRQLPQLKMIAERAGCMAAVVTQVPNQPLFDGKSEDALVAYTFDQYLKTGDESWPLLFPMVKSAVKAMDTVAEFARKDHGEEVKEFVVSGASKRGWTTWLTGATDPRVKGIAPMVIDMLNIKAQTDWAQKVYGRQSHKISDYTDLNLVAKMALPAMQQLRDWVDPYTYRNRYTMPKLLLLGTNDPYWTVDSLRHYWDDLPEPKLVFQTPNAGHNLNGGDDAMQTLAAFVEMIADSQPLPKMHWAIASGDKATLSIEVDQKAKEVRLWTADSSDRDFRDNGWTSQPLKITSGSSKAQATINQPRKGYRSYMGEVVLTAPTGHDYKLSTAARVIPDTQP